MAPTSGLHRARHAGNRNQDEQVTSDNKVNS
jgi:hypothetical protein